MLNRLRFFREQGWVEIDAKTYQQIWQQYGGSVITHPLVVKEMASIADIPVRYLGSQTAGNWQAAIATWGHSLALSKHYLKKHGKKRIFDLGNAEVIIPINPQTKIKLRHEAEYVSELNYHQLIGLKDQKKQLALVVPLEAHSSKFRNTMKRKVKHFEQTGGQVYKVSDFSPQQLATIYRSLFMSRFGFEAPAAFLLDEVFKRLYSLMFGHVLFHEGEPLAIQILYKAVSPKWVSIEFINGGVDLKKKELSAGSVLHFLNISQAWQEAQAENKELRYSFGRTDRDYKLVWGQPHPVYRT